MRCLLLLTTILMALPAAAQRPRSVLPLTREALSPADSARATRFALAQSFLNAAQIERAIVILEDLIAEKPNDHAYYEALKEAYESVKQYENAIGLVNERLDLNRPGTAPLLMVERARLRYLNGDEAGALDSWDAVLVSAGDQERLYRLVYESMMQVRLIDRAIIVLERGRASTKRPELFQTELAYLHGLVGAHDLAMAEYLALLKANARQINYVRSRLSQALQQEGAMESSLPIVRTHVAQQPSNRSFRELYAWMLTENGDYEAALAEYRTLSQEEAQAGHILFDFATQAADLGAFDVAAGAFDEVLTRHPETPVAAEAQLGLAGMHRRQADRLSASLGEEEARPHYESALAAYRRFLDAYPTHAESPETLRRIGELQHTVLHRYEDAELTLLEVVQRYTNTRAALQARFDLGRLAIDRNRLEEGRIIFERLEASLGHSGALAERARFERALIQFYQGDLETAGALVTTLNQNASTDIANDAIALRVLLLENPGPDSANAAVQHFAAAKLLYRQRQLEATIDAAEQLLSYWGQHPIADDARFLRGQALLDAGRLPEALLAFGELALIHPESPLADRSLFNYATILDIRMQQVSEARAAYADFLLRYPSSLLVPEVRARLRALREAGV